MTATFERMSTFRRDIDRAIAKAAERQNIREDQVWALALSWLIQTGEVKYGTERVVAALRGVADDLDNQCGCSKCRQ
jgi:hypothetical protein